MDRSLARLSYPILPIAVQIGGANADVLLHGYGSTGVRQVNCRVPANAPDYSVPIVLTVEAVGTF